MRKCYRCGAEKPSYEVLGDAKESLVPSNDTWDLCNDCYGQFLYLMDKFTHRTHYEIELALEHMPEAWWRTGS